jgi:predicted N-formylglutamate amidohydrolase
MKEVPESLLATDEPAAVAMHNENGSSPLLIFVDHAGNLTPHTLGRLGVTESEYLSYTA